MAERKSCSGERRGDWWKLHQPELLTCLRRHLERLAVAEGALPPPRCEHLVLQTTVDDTKLHLEGDRELQEAAQKQTLAEDGRAHLSVHGEADRNSNKRKPGKRGSGRRVRRVRPIHHG